MSKETALPLTFMARMAALLDEDVLPFFASLNQWPRSALRVNTLKMGVDAFLSMNLWSLEPVPWCSHGFMLPRNTNAGLHPFHDAGLYYIQEPSTMAVATLLAPQPGERVLDLCGAPGGKATHMAALLQNQGLLVANELDRQRASVLRRNLERWGARNAVVLNETPDRLAAQWPGSFDRVLVDAPCSGEGMFRKNELARYHWSEAHVQGCALRQEGILEAAARLVRPGGWLAYATCTFAPEENEGVVFRFLRRFPEFTLQEPTWFPGFTTGNPAWVDWPQSELAKLERGEQELSLESSAAAETEARSATTSEAALRPRPSTGSGPFPVSHAREVSLADLAASLQRTVRIWPHRAPGEGHYIALLRRTGGLAKEPVEPEAWVRAEPARLSSRDEAALLEFWASLIAKPLPERLALHARDRDTVEVFNLAEDAPETEGLRVLRPGWHLGTLRKGRFLPAHALAMGLRSEEVVTRLDEPIGSEWIFRYLRGESLPVQAQKSLAGPAGWLLVTVAGFPLGWGKRSGKAIKNHYPREQRWL